MIWAILYLIIGGVVAGAALQDLDEAAIPIGLFWPVFLPILLGMWLRSLFK